jgi:hypothetical protein
MVITVMMMMMMIIIIIIIISTHTSESTDVEAQKSLILQTALYAPLTVRAE